MCVEIHHGEKNAKGGMSGHVFPSHCMATWLCSSEGFEEWAITI